MLTPFPPSPPGQDHLAGRGPAPPLRTPGGVTGRAQGRGGVCAQALRPPCLSSLPLGWTARCGRGGRQPLPRGPSSGALGSEAASSRAELGPGCPGRFNHHHHLAGRFRAVPKERRTTLL